VCGKHGAVGENRLAGWYLPLVLDVDCWQLGELRCHAGARHGRERRAAEHEVGPGAVRDDHPRARRGAELLVLAPDLRSGIEPFESGKQTAGEACSVS
jgi:hypothetical protein